MENSPVKRCLIVPHSTTMVLRTVATWSERSNVTLFSISMPSSSFAIWRCPLLDTGRNSVRP